MSKATWNLLQLSSAAVSAAVVLANSAIAAEKPALDETKSVKGETAPQLAQTAEPQTEAFRLETDDLFAEIEANDLSDNDLLGQIPGTRRVNSVDDFSDVPPGHWAREALDDLIQDYGCIAGYPDGTYRGNRTLTRYEFAAALDACVDAILGDTDPVTLPTGRLDAIERLQEEFAAELATLRGRVDSLEERVQFLEDHQFSTTTKLSGEVIFALGDTFGNAVGTSTGDPTQTIFADRVRLNFDTSFTGRDRLRTRLQARNITPFNLGVTGTDETRLGFDGTDDDGGNDVQIDDLYYRFPLSDSIDVYLAGNSTESEDITSPLAPFESSGSGAVSRFGRFNPVFRQASGSGLGVVMDFGGLGVDIGYLAENANDPDEGKGLFNGQYSAFANVSFDLSDDISLGAFYNRYYAPGGDVNLTGSTGTENAQKPFGSVATSADSVGAQLEANFGSLVAGGWFGYTWADDEFNDNNAAEIVNWAATLGLNDLGPEGSALALVVGQPPRTVDNDLNARDDSGSGSTWHLELFYRYQLNDHIAITPGAFWLINPQSNSSNSDIIVTTIRTTFKF